MQEDQHRAAISYDSTTSYAAVAVIQLDHDGAAICESCDNLTEHPVEVDGLLVCEDCA